MAAFETIRAQVTCDFNSECPSTVLLEKAGIQKVRRTAVNSFDWVVVDGMDVCPNHKGQALRAKQKREVVNG